MTGYIALYRDICDHWIWQLPKQALRWLDLIMLAEWEDKAVVFGNQRVRVKRGQFVTSTRILMGRWKTNAKTVLSLLKLLEREEMIKCSKSHKMTIITISNYNKYQRDVDTSSDDNDSQRFLEELQTFLPTDSKQKPETFSEVHGKQPGKQTKEDNNEKNFNHTINSHERETNFYKELKGNDMFFDLMAAALHFDKEYLYQLLEDFYNEMMALEIIHKDSNDYKTHFYHWANKRDLNKPRNGRRTKQKTDGESQNRLDSRRGHNAEDHKAEDYDGAF